MALKNHLRSHFANRSFGLNFGLGLMSLIAAASLITSVTKITHTLLNDAPKTQNKIAEPIKTKPPNHILPQASMQSLCHLPLFKTETGVPLMLKNPNNNYILSGIIASKNPAYSIVMIKTENELDTAYKQGDILPNGNRIYQIHSDKVIVQDALGTMEAVFLFPSIELG